MTEHYIERCDSAALAVYLFLVTVADVRGLSYYGDARLAQSLSMPVARMSQARSDLMRLNLIAFQAPLYQVLSLDPPPLPLERGTQELQATLERIRAAFAGRAPDSTGKGR